MTAENLSSRTGPGRGLRRFNEAAADDRGKPLARRGLARRARRASMRPRPMTAENRERPTGTRRPTAGFNEAAADDRGKPRTTVHVGAPDLPLQ